MTPLFRREPDSREGAQRDATPVVPCAQAITGRGAADGRFDTITKPLATAGTFGARVVV